MTEAAWAALVLELPCSLEEELAGVLGQESLGVETLPIGGDRCRMKVYVASRAQAERLKARLEVPLRALDLTPERCSAAVVPVEDLRWAERYQRSLRPFAVGERFLVVPDGRAPRASGRVPLALVPGRAFGTGEHPTTQLCVRALELWVRPGSRWLDLGCGSGILSLVALHLGARAVEARDTDPEAVDVAREVLKRNEAPGVRVTVGSAADLAGAGLDGVVANIASAYFLAAAGEVAATLRDGGVLLASGFLREDLPALEGALGAAGLRVIDVRHQEEWVLLVARYGAPGRASR